MFIKKLIDKKLLAQQAIDEAGEEQKKTGKNIFKILVDNGHIEENALLGAVAESLNIEFIDLSRENIERGAINKISASTVKFYNIVPLRVKGDTVTVAVSDPLNMKLADELGFVTGLNIRMVVAKQDDINKAIERYYGEEEESTRRDHK